MAAQTAILTMIAHMTVLARPLPSISPGDSISISVVRATAVSFCNGTGRVITSIGPLVAGLLAGSLGGAFNQATAVMTCFAGLSIVAALLGRETKDDELPR